MKILIVEDNDESRYLLEVLLKGHGYDVVSAFNGAQALQKLKSGEFGLIISDILMPVMDGFELCRRIKTDPAFRDILFIFYTATYTGQKDEEFARRIGADSFIRKPCEPDELLQTIHGVVEAAKNSECKNGNTPDIEDEAEVYKLYNERLVRKLEQQMLALEAENSKREAAEKELYNTAMRLQLALRSGQIGLWDWNLKTNEVYFSPEWKSQLGYEEHEISGQYEEWETRLHPEDRERTLAEIEAYLQGRSSEYSVEFRLRHKDGAYRWLYARGETLPDSDGKPSRILGCHVDITERKRMEEAYKNQSEQEHWFSQRLRDLFEISQTLARAETTDEMCRLAVDFGRRRLGYDRLGIWFIHESDPKTMVGSYGIDENGQIRDERGIRLPIPPENIPKPVLEEGSRYLIHRDSPLWNDREQDIGIGDNLIAPMHAASRLIGLISVDNLISHTPITDWQCELLCLYATHLAHLITLKSAEETLKRSEKTYRDAIEVAQAAVYYQNYRTNEFDFVSPNIEQLTGYPPEEFSREIYISLMRENVLLGDLADLSFEEASRKAKGGEGVSWKADNRIVTRNGEERWLANYAVQVRGEKGEVTGSLGILQDITERKHLEEQLRQSQKMEAVGRLAGGVAHDFNNMLMVINGYSDFALTKLLEGDPIRGDVQQIKEAGIRSAALVRQLLAFSRKQVFQPKSVDLEDTIKNMEKMLQRLIGEDIMLHIASEPNLGRVVVDPGQIEQVIMNLAVNARDAMPQGGKLAIEMTNAELDERFVRDHVGSVPGRYVKIAVSDTGIGMDKKTMSLIFEPFFTTKEAGKGTGLGLATIYGIVKQSSGYITVDSEPGQGANFEIYLPRTDTPAAAQLAEVNSSGQPKGSETVLVIEDDDALRAIVCRMLDKSGYNVMDAANGEKALSLCNLHPAPIHIAVTDVVMPKMSGCDLAGRLKELRPEIKVLFMSGHTEDAIGHHGVLEKDIAFLPKPFTSEALARKVREMLDAPRDSAA